VNATELCPMAWLPDGGGAHPTSVDDERLGATAKGLSTEVYRSISRNIPTSTSKRPVLLAVDQELEAAADAAILQPHVPR
jgi:hypothetical protein